MTHFTELLDNLQTHGIRVTGPKDGDPDDRLYLDGPRGEKIDPVIVKAVKAFKRELVGMYGRKPEEPPPGGESEPR